MDRIRCPGFLKLNVECSSKLKTLTQGCESILIYTDPDPTFHFDPDPTFHFDPDPTFHFNPDPTFHFNPDPTFHFDPDPTYQLYPDPKVKAQESYFVEIKTTHVFISLARGRLLFNKRKKLFLTQ